MVKAGGTLPLYGVCCTVEEVLHRPPSLARPRYCVDLPYNHIIFYAR
jgi:hypothetical protein